jgi:hypothetical protein
MVEISVDGGEIVEGEVPQNIGHLVGKFTYIRQWADEGQEVPSKTATWVVRPDASGAVSV